VQDIQDIDVLKARFLFGRYFGPQQIRYRTFLRYYKFSLENRCQAPADQPASALVKIFSAEDPRRTFLAFTAENKNVQDLLPGPAGSCTFLAIFVQIQTLYG
jgi:hypothetical protein